MSKTKIEIIEGLSGLSLYINDYRVAGSKPYGGGRTVKQWQADVQDLISALGVNTLRAALGEKE